MTLAQPLVPAAAPSSPPLPAPRGEFSGALLEALLAPPHAVALPEPGDGDPLVDEDLQLSLYACYELHYRGFAGVDAEWEWEPSLLAARRRLEAAYLSRVEELAPRTEVDPAAVGATLFDLAEADETPSVSRFLERCGSAEQFREFMVHRSAYQLKEADPHTWGIPRLAGPAKAAMVEIQADEYGSGRPERMHSALFAKAMAALGLDAAYGAYLDRIPGSTLAGVNLTTMLGLQRRHRGALAGHLAMFEITSAIPNRRYGNALRRLGLASPAAVDFYDEHVEADSLHENIAAYDLAGQLATSEPELAADVVFGARALLAVDGHHAARVLGLWHAGESSLLPGEEVAAG